MPAGRLVGPAAVLDFSADASADPDFLVEVDHIRTWEAEHGQLPEGGWLLVRTDRKLARYRAALNARADPATVAGWISDVQRPREAAEARIIMTEASGESRRRTEIKALGFTASWE